MWARTTEAWKTGYSLRNWSPYEDLTKLETLALKISAVSMEKGKINGLIETIKRNLAVLDREHNEVNSKFLEMEQKRKLIRREIDYYYSIGDFPKFREKKRLWEALEIEYRTQMFPEMESFNEDVKEFVRSIIDFCNYLSDLLNKIVES